MSIIGNAETDFTQGFISLVCGINTDYRTYSGNSEKVVLNEK